MPELPRDDLAEAAEEATRRYDRYKQSADGHNPGGAKRLRLLRRAADRAKLALHRSRR